MAYGKLPPKEAEADPWEILCVDLIGPYKIKNKNSKEDITLHKVTMINSANVWFKITEIANKEAYTVAESVEQT